MAKPICYCGGDKSSYKTALLNPNAFQVNENTPNSPVQLEDLTIYVELSTYKKGRTVLVQSKEGDSSESKKAVTVNFIEGSNVGGLGGKKYLTTKFTDLTTSFDKNSTSSENLGITSIDVDFNSSYAPMITINFVDLRGSAIFQNDRYIKDGTNPYSVFFELPYPLYKLKIKGYYGQPVEYCLHMTKFTSRFNSQTGNFEITASFVGYTYAMLSDMLIGVLKAISYTDCGGEKYKKLKEEDPSLLTLYELYTKLKDINIEAKKILSTDENYAGLKNYTDTLQSLSNIKSEIDTLGREIDGQPVNQYTYYIVDYTTDESINKKVSEAINNYTKNVTKIVNEYNETIKTSNLTTNLDIDVFKNIILVHENISLDSLGDNETDKKIKDFIKANDYVKNNNVTIYDNTEKFKALTNQENNTNDAIASLKKTIAQTLRSSVAGNLGFEPTVKNIVRTFTTAVEVYLSCLYDVSVSTKTHKERKETLSKKFIPKKNVDYNNDLDYFPWPTYMNDDDGTLTEKYLGSSDVNLDDPSSVDEIVFINDLFKAFIEEAQKEKNFDALIKQKTTNWFSVNPIDSSLFNEASPYKRQEPISPSEVAVLVTVRAMIFMGLSNLNLTDIEITEFAKKEAEAVMNNLSDKNLFDGFANTFKTNEKFLSVTGLINNKYTNVVVKDGDNYYYNYIGDGDSKEDKKIFPIKKDFFNAEWYTNIGDIRKQLNNGNILLSNYQTSFYDGKNSTFDLTNRKPYLSDPATLDTYKDDGGTYVKIIEPTFFKSKSDNQLFSSPPSTTITIKLEEIKNSSPDLSAAGFNSLGGYYGVQQFTDLDYGTDDLKGLPFRYVFFTDSISKTYRTSINGLSLTRNVKDLNNTTRDGNTKYDTTKDNYSVFMNIESYNNTIDGVQVDINQKITNAASGGGSFGNGKISTPNYNHYYLGQNRLLITNLSNNSNINNITYPLINFQIKNINYSLFGSSLYNRQNDEKAKALLFLHSFPWNGLTGDDGVSKTIFSKFEIQNIFKFRAGFVSVPKIWAAFLGGLIWRHDSATDPLIFFDPTAPTGYKSLIPSFGDKNPSVVANDKYYPQKNQYLTLKSSDVGLPFSFGENYKNIDPVLLTLPEQAKDEFKKAFYDFVDVDWQDLKSNLEIYTGNDWYGNYLSAMNTGGVLNLPTKDANGSWVVTIDKARLNNFYKNVNQYSMFSPIIEITNQDTGTINPNDDFKFNIFLELNDGSNAVKNILDTIQKEMVLVNASPNVWNQMIDTDEFNPNDKVRKAIEVSTKNLETYFSAFTNTINPDGKVKSTFDDEKKQTEQDLFGTVDENAIKFMLYKSCKNIYDKWIGDTNSNSVLFQCGGRGPVDYEIAQNRNVSEPKLIDSFRFVNRAFKDIGDDLAINPLPVADYLKDNPNSSFYDCITQLLSSNNFDFIALPNFINYNDEKELRSVFQTYATDIKVNTCGPSFVCVYLGERSKNLDFGDSSYYPNDSFDVVCDEEWRLPSDLTGKREKGEEPVVFFDVTFGQQNQNIFKDVTLDQSEFSETAESLKIMDDISLKGADSNKSFAGQNIYNVYSVRSYKVEVDMLGDAMIQPMMYFQLNNIPMFHGAYMITRVKHNIVPNHMSTKFTGVRIRKPKTKIFDLNELYMSLLDTMNLTQNATTASKTFGQQVSGSYPPIVRTIIENGGVNGNIESPNIKLVNVDEITGVLQNVVSDRRKMIAEAVPALTEMLKDFVTFAEANKYPDINGNYIAITSLYRSLEYQKQLYDENIKNGGEPGAVATPGFSNHSWGIAIDFQFLPQKDGESFLKVGNWSPVTTKASKEGFNLTINPSLKWFLDNGWKYGFISPKDLRDQTGVEEYWHFEYHGTSAYCLYSKFPTTYGYTPESIVKPDIKDSSYKPVVKNPKDKNNNIAVYLANDCDYKTIKSGDGSANKATISNDKTIINNQTEVKNYLKAKGLTQTQVAGIMGNIQKESGFNPLAENKADVNGYPSVGLIQWNGRYTPAGGSKDANIIFSTIGRTVNQQLDYLTTKYPDYNKWLNLGGNLTAYSSAYEFARLVEKCVGCISGEEVYKTNKYNPSDRSEYANDFYRRFSLNGDYLFW
jgi:LAS superfamily LD-carboxypeptidase LdcB